MIEVFSVKQSNKDVLSYLLIGWEIFVLWCLRVQRKAATAAAAGEEDLTSRSSECSEASSALPELQKCSKGL